MKGITLTEFAVSDVSSAAPFDFRPFSAQTPVARSVCPDAEGGRKKRGREPVRPVVLLEGGALRTVVVDGYRRLRDARRSGVSKLPALILPPNTPKESVINQALFGRRGGFSGVERITAVYKTGSFQV